MAAGDQARRGGEGAKRSLVFRLQHRGRDVWLSRGQMLLGRSAECAMVLGDPLVSRVHARITVHEDHVIIEDLRSANGVLVNGVRIDGASALESGDAIVIGAEELWLFSAAESGQVRVREPVATVAGEPPAAAPPAGAGDEPTSRRDILQVIGELALKTMALGRGEEAERLLSTHLENLLAAASSGRGAVAPEQAERAAVLATKLAGATGKASWVDFVIRMYAALGRPMPGPVVDPLYELLRRLPPIDLRLLREYLRDLEHARGLGPTDRFLVKRAQGLEAIAVLR